MRYFIRLADRLSSHAIPSARHRRRRRSRPQGTTNPRPSCKTSRRHSFWRLQDPRIVPRVGVGVLARAIGTEYDRSEPPITPIAGRVTTPTGDSLTTHSLLTDAATATVCFFAREKEKKTRRFPRPETLSVAFQFDPAPGDVVTRRSLDYKSIPLNRIASIGISGSPPDP